MDTAELEEVKLVGLALKAKTTNIMNNQVSIVGTYGKSLKKENMQK